MNVLVVITTLPNFIEAEFLAGKIVTRKLAACVQILPQMTSVYVWEGKLQKEGECLLLMKTTNEMYDELEAFIVANHSYDIPEVAAIEAERVSDAYKKWLVGSLI